MPKLSSRDDPERLARRFLVRLAGLMGAVGLALAAWPLFASLSPAADLTTPVWVDLSDVPVGDRKTVRWGDDVIFIAHRTPEEIAAARAIDAKWADRTWHLFGENDSERVQRPEWVVVVGRSSWRPHCRLSGQNPGEYRGRYGGSHETCREVSYDTSGRAPMERYWLNLAVPPYRFSKDDEIEFPHQN